MPTVCHNKIFRMLLVRHDSLALTDQRDAAQALGLNTPALLTRVSMRPKCSIAAAATRSAVAGGRTAADELKFIDLEHSVDLVTEENRSGRSSRAKPRTDAVNHAEITSLDLGSYRHHHEIDGIGSGVSSLGVSRQPPGRKARVPCRPSMYR
jgi:hypothetical protein